MDESEPEVDATYSLYLLPATPAHLRTRRRLLELCARSFDTINKARSFESFEG